MSFPNHRYHKPTTRSGKDALNPSAENDNMSNMHVLMVALYFSSMFLIFIYFQKTFLSLNELFKLLSLIIVASFLIPIAVYRLKLTMSYYEYILWNLLSLSPILCALLLFLNFHLTDSAYKEVYKIERIDKRPNNIVLMLESNAHAENKFVREFSINEYYESYGADSLEIIFADGLFGRKVLKDRKFK